MNILKALMQWARRKWWLLFIIFIVIAAVAWWWKGREAQQAALTFTQPQYRDIIKTHDFSGQIDAHERVGMRFAGGGKLVYLGAKEGDAVKKGQTVASLDQRSVQKALDKTLSLYETQRWNYENEKDEAGDRLTLDQQEQRTYEQNQFALDRSVYDVQLQYLAFDNYRISAPFGGILVSTPTDVSGIVVGVTDTWELINPDTLYFRLFVDEVDIDTVSVGQQATVELDAYPDRTYQAQVSKVGYQTLNTTQGSVFAVDVAFTQPVSIEETRVGMNGEARLLEAEKKNVLSVPIEAVTSRDGKSFVEVWQDGKRQEREVEIGLENEDHAEILSGLSPQDQVILP